MFYGKTQWQWLKAELIWKFPGNAILYNSHTKYKVETKMKYDLKER